jgi:hypothetical protein
MSSLNPIFQTSASGQGFDNFYALVGAFQTQDRRYLDFVDGFAMFDGNFADAGTQVGHLEFCLLPHPAFSEGVALRCILNRN